MSSSEPLDEDSPPSAQRRDIIPQTQEDLHYDTETVANSVSDTVASNVDTESDDLSDPPDPDRPNRANSVAFRRDTTHEREVSNSVEGMRSRDLAVHLYNAFQLHERAKRLRAHSAEAIWGPPRNWTAWPAPAEQVPREREEAPYTENHSWTLCGKPNASSREALEESLIASASKRARENFESRFPASNSESADDASVLPNEPDDNRTDNASIASSEPQIWKAELTTQTRNPLEIAEHDADLGKGMDDLTDIGTQLSSDTQAADVQTSRIKNVSSDVKRNLISRDQKPLSSTDESASRPIETFLVEKAELYPGPLTDDDQIRTLLNRPIRHTLTMFDSLLAAMHHSRASHLRRARGFYNARMKASPVSFSNATTQSIVETAKMAQDNSVKHKLENYKPWDWSNILGFAALAGWEPEVVQRTRARCERLFGQQMDFVTSVGGSKDVATVADPASAAIYSMQDAIMSDVEADAQSQDVTNVAERADAPLSAVSITQDDPSSRRGSFTQYKRSDSRGRIRKYPKLEPEAGLHVDGFLQPIDIRRGWSRRTDVKLPHWWTKLAPMEMAESEPETSIEEDVPMADEDPAEPADEALAATEPVNPVPVDPELAAIDPALLDPSINTPAPVPLPASPPAPASSSPTANPVEQSSEPPIAPKAPPKPRKKMGRPRKPKEPTQKVEGPQAPKRLRPTKWPRTQEELDYWRKKGYVEMNDKAS